MRRTRRLLDSAAPLIAGASANAAPLCHALRAKCKGALNDASRTRAMLALSVVDFLSFACMILACCGALLRTADYCNMWEDQLRKAGLLRPPVLSECKPEAQHELRTAASRKERERPDGAMIDHISF